MWLAHQGVWEPLVRDVCLTTGAKAVAGKTSQNQKTHLWKRSWLFCDRKWGLAAQHSKAFPGWWEGKFILVAGNQGDRGGCTSVQRPILYPDNKGAKAFIGSGRGLHAETVQSALTVIFKSVIGDLTNVILIVLSTISLQFQGWFVPISLRPVLRTVAIYVMDYSLVIV